MKTEFKFKLDLIYILVSIGLMQVLACKSSELKKDVYSLNGPWQLVSMDSSYTCQGQVPGYVYLDLVNNNLVADPYVGLNESKNRFLEEKSWRYTKKFNWNLQQNGVTELVCEGIDTYASIYINDQLIGQTDNMFRAFVFEIGSLLNVGENEIEIILHSPFTAKQKEVEGFGFVLPADNEDGDIKYSPFCRKAAYHFGWDWGPRIVSSGIYKDIFICTHPGIKVENYSCQTLAIEEDNAKVVFNMQLTSTSETSVDISLGDYLSDSYQLVAGQNRIKDTFSIKNPQLWWPNGRGKAHLYNAPLIVKNRNAILKNDTIQFGIRTSELIQEKDTIGTSFFFKINGQALFAKGANYIPQDIFCSRPTDAQYRKLLLMAKNAGMNMLRVWGGGIYEKDIFYHLCDSLGIMVWQDLMFAGTMYPTDSAFIDEVAQEVSYQADRLSKHPSIVLFCGNNELEVAWHNWGWQEKYKYTQEIQDNLWNGYVRLFHDSIPTWLSKVMVEMPYVPTSPQSNWGTVENFNHSSMHYWGVWHGRQNISTFRDNVGRFMVEYGMQSYPSFGLLEKYAEGLPIEWNSEFVLKRQKSYIGNEELMRHVLQYYDPPKDFTTFIDYTQEVQAKALDIALDAHLSAKDHCMGSLIWQLNDCWPGASWSIIDYELNPKKAYKVVKEHFRE